MVDEMGMRVDRHEGHARHVRSGLCSSPVSNLPHRITDTRLKSVLIALLFTGICAGFGVLLGSMVLAVVVGFTIAGDDLVADRLAIRSHPRRLRTSLRARLRSRPRAHLGSRRENGDPARRRAARLLRRRSDGPPTSSKRWPCGRRSRAGRGDHRRPGVELHGGRLQTRRCHHRPDQRPHRRPRPPGAAGRGGPRARPHHQRRPAPEHLPGGQQRQLRRVRGLRALRSRTSTRPDWPQILLPVARIGRWLTSVTSLAALRKRELLADYTAVMLTRDPAALVPPCARWPTRPSRWRTSTATWSTSTSSTRPTQPAKAVAGAIPTRQSSNASPGWNGRHELASQDVHRPTDVLGCANVALQLFVRAWGSHGQCGRSRRGRRQRRFRLHPVHAAGAIRRAEGVAHQAIAGRVRVLRIIGGDGHVVWSGAQARVGGSRLAYRRGYAGIVVLLEFRLR